MPGDIVTVLSCGVRESESEAETVGDEGTQYFATFTVWLELNLNLYTTFVDESQMYNTYILMSHTQDTKVESQ